jgi:hypothetical protein
LVKLNKGRIKQVHISEAVAVKLAASEIHKHMYEDSEKLIDIRRFSPDSPVRESEIPMATETANRSINLLIGKLESLEKRLQSVLRPEMPVEGSGRPERSINTKLGNEIWMVARMAESAVDKVSNLLDRLEI